jgi:outer membrane receptor protein involved in Fe transport
MTRNAAESIVKGAEIDTAPRWQGNLLATWRPTAHIAAELEWSHVGEYFTNAANTRRYDGHDIQNLRARWTIRPDAEVYAALRNLADVRYAERADFAFGVDRYFPGEPRNVTVGLRLRR